MADGSSVLNFDVHFQIMQNAQSILRYSGESDPVCSNRKRDAGRELKAFRQGSQFSTSCRIFRMTCAPNISTSQPPQTLVRGAWIFRSLCVSVILINHQNLLMLALILMLLLFRYDQPLILFHKIIYFVINRSASYYLSEYAWFFYK